MLNKRTGGRLFVDRHSADGVDGSLGCVHFVCRYVLLIIFFHEMPTSSLRDSPHISARFSKR
jgi:hypothetical protein